MLCFLHLLERLVAHSHLLAHVEVVELDLADEASVLTPAVQRLEALKDAVDDEGVVLVSNGDKVTVAARVDAQRCRTVGFGDIDADWVASDALHDLVQLQVLQRKHSEVAIVARGDDPVFFAISADPEGDQIVDLAAIEPKDHVWIDLFNLVFVVAHDVVEAPVGVDLTLDRDALSDVVEALVQHSD